MAQGGSAMLEMASGKLAQGDHSKEALTPRMNAAAAGNSDAAESFWTQPIRTRTHMCRGQFGHGRTCDAANSDSDAHVTQPIS